MPVPSPGAVITLPQVTGYLSTWPEYDTLSCRYWTAAW